MRSRISREQSYVGIVQVIAKRGTCLRAKVGAVLIKDGRPLSTGFNGSLPGEDHCTGETCTVDAPCKNSVHAEANAIYFAAKQGLATEGATLYCTHSPCVKCTEAIVQAGIIEVVFIKEYRDTPWDIYQRQGIKIRQVDAHDL